MSYLASNMTSGEWGLASTSCIRHVQKQIRLGVAKITLQNLVQIIGYLADLINHFHSRISDGEQMIFFFSQKILEVRSRNRRESYTVHYFMINVPRTYVSHQWRSNVHCRYCAKSCTSQRSLITGLQKPEMTRSWNKTCRMLCQSFAEFSKQNHSPAASICSQ